MDSHKRSNSEEVELKHTKRGVLYADPRQILRSSNAKKQIEALKRSSIWRKLQRTTSKA